MTGGRKRQSWRLGADMLSSCKRIRIIEVVSMRDQGGAGVKEERGDGLQMDIISHALHLAADSGVKAHSFASRN